MIRISRPCYDKPHRCPGWAGGGLRYARTRHCDGGTILRAYEPGRWWPWLPHRCGTCGMFVLPSHVRWVDPVWLAYTAACWFRDRPAKGRWPDARP